MVQAYYPALPRPWASPNFNLSHYIPFPFLASVPLSLPFGSLIWHYTNCGPCSLFLFEHSSIGNVLITSVEIGSISYLQSFVFKFGSTKWAIFVGIEQVVSYIYLKVPHKVSFLTFKVTCIKFLLKIMSFETFRIVSNQSLYFKKILKPMSFQFCV